MTDSFFSMIDEARVLESIRRAEGRSRGEIRVHITNALVADVVKEAAAAFERLGMTATAERNGILIFIAPRSQKFAVLGDSGITTRVGTAPLNEMASSMSAAFREGRFTDGLAGTVDQAGDLLATHFPRAAGDLERDELPDEISRG